MSTLKSRQALAKRGRKERQQSKPEKLLPKHRLIGYARVSTAEQNLQMQIDDLLAAGVHPDNLHVEKVSGVKARRPKLTLALMDARRGDTFVVWKLDRLGRNAGDLYRLVEEMIARGVKFKCIKDNIDTETAVGKLIFGFFAIMAQFERDQTVERTINGLAAARRRGYVPGAKRRINVDRARDMLRTLTVSEMARKLKCTPNAIRRYFTLEQIDDLRNGKA